MSAIELNDGRIDDGEVFSMTTLRRGPVGSTAMRRPGPDQLQIEGLLVLVADSGRGLERARPEQQRIRRPLKETKCNSNRNQLSGRQPNLPSDPASAFGDMAIAPGSTPWRFGSWRCSSS